MPRRTSFLSILLVLAMTAAALTPWAAGASRGLAPGASRPEAPPQAGGFPRVPPPPPPRFVPRPGAPPPPRGGAPPPPAAWPW